eukprot:gene54054-biopygen38436
MNADLRAQQRGVARRQRFGDALDAQTQIGPVVDATQLKQDEDYIAIGVREGATLAFGGERLDRKTPGFYLSPALLT